MRYLLSQKARYSIILTHYMIAIFFSSQFVGEFTPILLSSSYEVPDLSERRDAEQERYCFAGVEPSQIFPVPHDLYIIMSENAHIL